MQLATFEPICKRNRKIPHLHTYVETWDKIKSLSVISPIIGSLRNQAAMKAIQEILNHLIDREMILTSPTNRGDMFARRGTKEYFPVQREPDFLQEISRECPSARFLWISPKGTERTATSACDQAIFASFSANSIAFSFSSKEK